MADETASGTRPLTTLLGWNLLIKELGSTAGAPASLRRSHAGTTAAIATLARRRRR